MFTQRLLSMKGGSMTRNQDDCLGPLLSMQVLDQVDRTVVQIISRHGWLFPHPVDNVDKVSYTNIEHYPHPVILALHIVVKSSDMYLPAWTRHNVTAKYTSLKHSFTLYYWNCFTLCIMYTWSRARFYKKYNYTAQD